MKTFLFFVFFMTAFACANHSTPALAAQEEVTSVSVTADVSGLLNNKHLIVNQANADGGAAYCFWIRVVGFSHSNPCTGGQSIPVDIAENETAEYIGYAFQTALYEADPAIWEYIGVTNVGDPFEYMMFFNMTLGTATDASAGNTGWDISVTQQGQD